MNVLDATYLDGGSAKDFSLGVTDLDDHVIVDVNVSQAEGLKALYFTMDYDAASLRPMTAEPSDIMGPKSDLLHLTYMKETGKVHYGQVIIHPSWRTGMSGDGVVVQLLFKKEAAPVIRTVMAVPDTDAAQTTLNWDSGTNTLSWLYYNPADYDQNGEVNLADLTPIAQNFGESVAPAAFPPTTAESVVDGDGNGEINLADITPIAQNFANSANGGYNVYHSTNVADYPTENTAPDQPTLLLANVPFNTATGNPATDRKAFSYVVAAPVAGDNYWVRPVDTQGNVGTPSTLAGGNNPVLSVQTPGLSGSGTAADPYIVAVSTDYTLWLQDPANAMAHIEDDPNSDFFVTPPAAGTVTPAAGSATLSVAAATSGDFSVHATFNSLLSNTIYFRVPPAGAPILSMPTPPAGSGTAADPYQVTPDTDYTLWLQDPTDGMRHIENDGDTTWPPNANYTITTAAESATMHVEAAATGTFSITANFFGDDSNTLYFVVVVAGGLEIFPDPADTDWAGVTGTGTELDPYVFPTETPFTTTYLFAADDAVGAGGNPVDVSTLTWDAFPPFIVTWPNPGEALPNQFTSGYVFAQTGAMEESNHIYVEVHALP